VAGRSSTAAGSGVLRSKLRPSVVGGQLVVRSRLHRLLDETVKCPLTLVVAPAGSGKSSLLATWTRALTTANAWLSVDEHDRDAVQLWSGMGAALETLAPGCSREADSLARRPATLMEAVATILDQLEVANRPAGVLVLDDVHLVDEDALAVRSLGLFLQHLPEWLHVVVVARREPRLPLGRLRARGQLAEVRFPELLFSQEEAVEMLTRLAPSLDQPRADDLARRAGGWAAGIQLAALAARSRDARVDVVPQTEEGGLLLEDYVLREVLGAESPELVQTLLDTAVVELVEPALAVALTGRADASQLLTLAEERGLFVSRVDPSGWYRMHSLVRDVLRAELSRRSPDRFSDRHVRAAVWFEETGEVPLALEHWLLAGRARDALRLLSAHATALYDGGREATIARVLHRIPSDVAAADVTAMVEYAFCHLLVDRRRFFQTVEQAGELARRTADLSPATRSRIDTLESFAVTMRGDWVGGREYADRVIRDLGDEAWLDPLGRFAWNMVAREVALSERWDDSGDEVEGARHALGIDPDRRLAFEGVRALGEALAGRPVDALRVAAGVRHAASVTNMTILRTELATAEALAHREMADLPRALDELTALAAVDVEPVPYCRLLAHLELARAHLDDGTPAAAERWFSQAEDLVEEELWGLGARSLVAGVGIRLALARGRHEDAERWSSQLDDPFWSGIGTARVLLARGDHAAARSALEQTSPRCLRHDVVLDLLRARTAATHEESLKWVMAAADRASANGLVQTVASEGQEVLRLVELAAWRVPPRWLDRLRRAGTPEVARGRVEAALGLVEALTDRERDVLRLLPSRLTLREIAAELSISMNTLKFHLKVIYRKLGCGSRAEAAEVARGLSRQRTGHGPSTRRR
jgi:LuxR family maltose regulon positive regulatory protein